jgi:hypothetical protein
MNADNNTILLPLKKAQELKVLGETLARLSGNPVIEEAADELQKLAGYDTTFYSDYPEIEADPPVPNSPVSAGEALENTANVLALVLWIYRKLGEGSTALDNDEEAGLVYLLNILRESLPHR